MKKAFTLIELLCSIAIIGIVSSVILASLSQSKCKRNPKCSAKIEQKNEVSSKTDKFIRTKETVPVKEKEDNNWDFSCSDVEDPSERKDCQDEEYKGKMIEECISRYSN